jgi:hypothetical protein
MTNMKKGDLRMITILDGWGEPVKIEARFLGRGSFATCYEVDGVVYSFVKQQRRETDYSKEAIAEFAIGEHLPEIEKIGVFDDGTMLFKSKLYQPLTPKHKTAWRQFRILESAWKNCRVGVSDYNFNYEIIEALRGQIEPSIIESLESLVDACGNYGDSYRLEFNKRNLKVDEAGRLILLDVIFNRKALKWHKPDYKKL